MSLAVLADHMASKGRGPDSMLIHMSPREVQGLQALAMAHGGSLTVNPDTGLPEALSLKKLLPALIGFGLNYFAPGLGSAVGSALGTSAAVGTGVAVGGFEALRTGDLGKGISAGLGAYGGAGLSEGLMAAGSTEAGLSSGALNAQLAQVQGLPEGLSSGDAFNNFLTSDANPAVNETLKNATPFDRMSAGIDAAKANPSSLLTKDNFKYMAAAAAPVLADQAVKSNLPTTTTKPGMIRPYSYDPYGGTYTAGTPYEAVPTRAAEGGLMGMAAGGMAGYGDGDDVPRRINDGMAQGGMFDFAQRSEPVVRMASGGIAHYAGNTGSLVKDASGFDQATINAALAAELAARGGTSQADLTNYAKTAYNLSDAQINAAYDTIPGFNAQGKYDAADYMANSKPGQVSPQMVVDAAAAANPYSAQNMAKVDVTRPGQYVTDPTTGQPVALSAYSPGFDINNPTALTYLGELSSKGGQDTTSQYFNKIATAEQKAKAADLWAKEKARLDALDAAKGLGALNQNQNLLTNQNQNLNLTNQNKDAGLAALAALPAGASDTYKWFTERGLGFNPIDISIDNFLDTYKTQLASMTPKQQEDAMRGALDKERMNEADVIKATGKTIAQLVQAKRADGSIIVPGKLDEVPVGSLPGGVSGGGNTVVNANGTITTRPDIPGIPAGGFTGMKNLRDVYEEGGGSLGVNKNLFVPKTQDELFARYKNTGGSKAALDYLMGKTPYSPVPVTPTGEIMKPYFESVGRFPENRKAKKYVFVNGKYELNPDYVKPSYVLAGEKAAALSNQDKEPTDNPGAGKKWVWNSVDKKWEAQAIGGDSGKVSTEDTSYQIFAEGGLAALTMAGGGMPEQFNLGGYSDGGRLLRGPGDGVSDSIPATIGGKRPARLADGEFVVPARIVSELGNGSTEAGARKLYAMMDRVQAARKGSIGKGKVANNSRADKYLPA